MSIIIENAEDIELLIEFYEKFNISKGNKEKCDCKLIIDEISNELLKKEDIIAMIKTEVKTAVQSELPLTVDENELDDFKTQVTIRKYKKKYEPFQITGLTKEGRFTQQKGKPFSFDIFDCLKLKKLIPKTEEYPNFQSLGEEFDVYIQSLIRLSYLIEIGEMDKWFNEWEQLQADDFYGNWKAIPTLNNPQKRRENGMV